MPETEDRICFVISPIGEPESETRRRADQVLKHIIRPPVEECGYEAIRADEIDRPGVITSQVIQHVVSDALVVADLTERNPNVFCELAIRHALRKPLVQIIEKGERIPFDVAGTRTVQVDHQDLDSVEEAKGAIRAQIRSLDGESDSEIETPISTSLDLQRLRQSDDPEERSVADILDTVTEIRELIAEYAVTTEKDLDTELRDLVSDTRKMLKRVQHRMQQSQRFEMSPSGLQEILMVTTEDLDDPVGFLIIASLFRDSAPWLHEAGIELYRDLKRGAPRQARESFTRFRRLLHMTASGPLAEEMLGSRRAHRDLRHISVLAEDYARRIFEMDQYHRDQS